MILAARVPRAIKSWWKIPRLTDSYVGTISFIIWGQRILYIPIEIPCIALPIQIRGYIIYTYTFCSSFMFINTIDVPILCIIPATHKQFLFYKLIPSLKIFYKYKYWVNFQI